MDVMFLIEPLPEWHHHVQQHLVAISHQQRPGHVKSSMSKDCSHTLPGKAGVERKGTIVIAPMRARPQPAHPASRPFLRRRQADRVHALPEKSLLPPEWHGPPLRRAIRQASV